MKKLLALIIFSIIPICYSVACECPPIETFADREKEYNQASHVFLAQNINRNHRKTTQKIKILEVFKGKFKSDFIELKDENNCSILINGIWLLYGNYRNDSTFEATICSASRSLETTSFPPAPHLERENRKLESLQNDINYLKRDVLEFRELYADIELYRSRKTAKKTNKSDSRIKYYFIFSIVLNLVLLTLIIYSLKTRPVKGKK